MNSLRINSRAQATAALLALALAFAAARAAHAGSMDLIDALDIDSGWTASWDPLHDSNIDITVDAVLEDRVVLHIFKDFTEDLASGLFIEPLVIQFQQRNPAAAVPFIVIADELIFNNTGLPWIGFIYELQGDASFDPDLSAGFAIDPFTQRQFTDANQRLVLSGGIVPSEPLGENIFLPGVAGGDLWIEARGNFTFSQQPIPIPLPPAALSGLALLAGLGALRGGLHARSAGASKQ